MTPTTVIATVLGYIAVLFAIKSRGLRARRADNAGFFTGNRRVRRGNFWRPFAMIGAAMSGVTFISVPGSVAVDSFHLHADGRGFHGKGQLVVAFVTFQSPRSTATAGGLALRIPRRPLRRRLAHTGRGSSSFQDAGNRAAWSMSSAP